MDLNYKNYKIFIKHNILRHIFYYNNDLFLHENLCTKMPQFFSLHFVIL